MLLDPDCRDYCPNPQELDIRKADLLWLKALGFSPEFIKAVIANECPGIVTVNRLIREQGYTAHGVEKRYSEYID